MRIHRTRIVASKLQGGQQVNRIGKYLYKHIDGAYDIKNSPNMCDVYIMLLYQIPKLERNFGHPEEGEMHEMDIDINITTYQNKIRVNVIEISPEERTLGCYVISEEVLQNLEEAKDIILRKIVKRVSKVYEDFDFIF